MQIQALLELSDYSKQKAFERLMKEDVLSSLLLLFIYESCPNHEKIEDVLFMQIQILNLVTHSKHLNKHQEMPLRLLYSNMLVASDNESTIHLKHPRKSQGTKSHNSFIPLSDVSIQCLFASVIHIQCHLGFCA